jgi:hypothetical protein
MNNNAFFALVWVINKIETKQTKSKEGTKDKIFG